MKKTITFLLALCLSVPSFAQCWKEVSTGQTHTVALKADGSLWTWGRNLEGELGDGTIATGVIPKQINPGTTWKSIQAGAQYSVAIKSDGTLWAWGYNSNSQLGDGTTGSKVAPVQIGADTTWTAICAGPIHAMGLKSNGTIWVLGSAANYGQFGDSTLTGGRTTPTQVGSDTDWIYIAAGWAISFAIKSNGTLWAWGLDNEGTSGLGIIGGARVKVPKQVGTATNWEKVSAGYSHTIGLQSNGTCWAWGSNRNGELGDGTRHPNWYVITPIQIGTDTNWTDIDAGYYHSLAIKTNGTLWAWGDNTFGALGDGSLIERDSPTQIDTATAWVSVRSKNYHSMATRSDSTLWAWGYNADFQLGDGTFFSRISPVQISCNPLSLNVTSGIGNGGIYLYPNPANKLITVKKNDGMRIDKIDLMDMTGRILLSTGADVDVVDIKGLNSGLYILQIHSGYGRQQLTFVRQ